MWKCAISQSASISLAGVADNNVLSEECSANNFLSVTTAHSFHLQAKFMRVSDIGIKCVCVLFVMTQVTQV